MVLPVAYFTNCCGQSPPQDKTCPPQAILIVGGVFDATVIFTTLIFGFIASLVGHYPAAAHALTGVGCGTLFLYLCVMSCILCSRGRPIDKASAVLSKDTKLE